MAGLPWDASYRDGRPPWDLGHRQPAIARLASKGGFAGTGIEIEFVAADALQLDRLGGMFETVLDCGLFHTFDGHERPGYVASLASATRRSGTLYVLCFSDDGADVGPHPIPQEELRVAFNPGNGWNIVAIEPDRIQTRFHNDGAPAWFVTIKRI